MEISIWPRVGRLSVSMLTLLQASFLVLTSIIEYLINKYGKESDKPSTEQGKLDNLYCESNYSSWYKWKLTAF